MTEKLYLKVTQDKYELPLCVCGSSRELAEKCGITQNAVRAYLRRARLYGFKYPRYIVIEVEEDEK